MTTSKQEQIYNQIVQYYDFADKLIDIVEDSKNKITPEQLEAVESIVENLEKYTDQLTTSFIDFVKNGNSEEVKQSIAGTLNKIIFKIEKCRSDIYELCGKSESDLKSSNQ